MYKNIFSRCAVTVLSLFIVFLTPASLLAQDLGGRKLEVAPPNTTTPKIEWLDSENNTVSLEDFRGRVVLLNFWATWCAPCVVEMPDLDALQKKYGRSGLEVVAISLNEEGLEEIKPFFEEHGLKYLEIYHGGMVPAQEFAVHTLPSTYLIGRDGMLVGYVPGFARWQTLALEKHIQATLRKGYAPQRAPFSGRSVRDFSD